MLLKRFGPAAAACVLLLGGCGQGQEGQEPAAEADEEETPPIPVETSTPTRGDIYAVYTGTAPIEAFAEADVIGKVAGEVLDILVEEGDDVTAGQVMARLDGDVLRLELNESEARLRKLQRDYYTQITAPISGVVSQRFVKIGNTISAGDPAFRVTSFDPLVAYLHIPEREYRNIRQGQIVGIEIDALQGRPIVAAVTRISPIVDPATGTFKITIEVRDEQRRIKPGMFGRIGIVYDKHENALQIPRSAILEESGETSVFIVVDNRATRKPIGTGYSDKGMVEVTDGLSDNDQVVTVGQVGLKDDATVTVINAVESTPELAESGDTKVSEDATPD
jgi:membrane fusion protein (multidrug efflux system)